jgi:hypothetical protein
MQRLSARSSTRGLSTCHAAASSKHCHKYAFTRYFQTTKARRAVEHQMESKYAVAVTSAPVTITHSTFADWQRFSSRSLRGIVSDPPTHQSSTREFATMPDQQDGVVVSCGSCCPPGAAGLTCRINGEIDVNATWEPERQMLSCLVPKVSLKCCDNRRTVSCHQEPQHACSPLSRPTHMQLPQHTVSLQRLRAAAAA